MATRVTDLAAVNEAFICACRFAHETVASLLLERLIALDPELGRHIEESRGRLAFIKYFIEKRPAHATALGPWKAFVMEQVSRAIRERDLEAFVRGQSRGCLAKLLPWFQADLIGVATLNDRGEFIVALLDLEPAILRHQPVRMQGLERPCGLYCHGETAASWIPSKRSSACSFHARESRV